MGIPSLQVEARLRQTPKLPAYRHLLVFPCLSDAGKTLPGVSWTECLSLPLPLQTCVHFFGLHVTKCGVTHAAHVFSPRNDPHGCLFLPILYQQ